MGAYNGGDDVDKLVPNLQLMRKSDLKRFNKWKRGLGIPINDPFCLIFAKGKYKLYYIACDHTNDPSSKTFKLITKIIHSARLNAVVVEGASGPHPEMSDGEGNHALSVAAQLGIACFGVETPSNIYCKMIAGSYKIEDIYGWIFLMIARQEHDQGYNEREMLEHYKLYSPWYHKYIETIDFDPYKWFANTYKTNYIYGKYLDYSSPRPGGHITRQIARAVASLRNPNIIRNLYELLNTHMSVCYIIGMGHAYVDLPVLLDTFGDFAVQSL